MRNLAKYRHLYNDVKAFTPSLQSVKLEGVDPTVYRVDDPLR